VNSVLGEEKANTIQPPFLCFLVELYLNVEHISHFSNLHNKKLKTINKKLIQTFQQTLEVQIIHKP